ncbi:class F sortase [bacterium]|nr:MAG: class F sortase [bacterium]
MTPGLNIDKTSDHHVFRWVAAFAIVAVMCISAWYAYLWYTKGETPPLPIVPASAMADPTIDETPITPAQVDAHAVPASHPRYISMPSLGIDKARVVSVGLTKQNLLDTPKNIADTAWFEKSATPGMGAGAVVIDGHNGGITRDGVFAKLASLNNGDVITIERGDGKKISYAVAENKTMSLQDANTKGMKDMMNSIDLNKEGLSLITCAGNWVPRDKVFDKRVMVRAVIID